MIQNQLFVSENVLDSVVVETPVVKKTIPVSPQAIESRKAKVIVGIPAYNEERFIAQIVLGVSKYADEVVVVDDGSTDRTAEVAKAAGASVIQHKINKGAGAATESCFKEARRRNADVLITMDGDGQHNPEEIVRVAVPALTGTADVVIGSRFLTKPKQMPVYRKFGIKIITWLCNLGSGTYISDTQSCFRAYGKEAIHSLSSTEQGFGFSVDLLIQCGRKKLSITEVPISCIYNDYSHSANPILHGLSVAYAVVKIRLKSGGIVSTNNSRRRGSDNASLEIS